MSATENQAFIQELKKQLPSTTVAVQGEDAYADSVASWNILTQFHPFAIVQPTSTEEVSTVLKLADQFDIGQIAVRSGGHSFEGLGLGGKDTSALVVDLIKFTSVESDPATSTLVADGGALLGQVYHQAWDNGEHMIPMGSCLGVGVGGQAQAGGYGHYSRAHGILSDHVTGFELVTPDGVVRQVSDDENADLFFALRGSGIGSFGVITKVRLRTQPAPKAVANFTVQWKLDGLDIPNVLKQIQTACLQSPTSLSPMIVIWQGIVEVAGSILADTPEERDAVWQQFLAPLSEPTVKKLSPMTFIESVHALAESQTSAPWVNDPSQVRREGAEHIRYMKIKAGFMPEIMSDDFFDQLGPIAAAQAAQGARLQILGLDPDKTPSPDTTSIKVRGCPWLMGMSVWLQASDWGGVDGATRAGVERLPWLNAAYEVFYPYTAGGYLGDDDLEEAKNGRNMYESYFGRHLPRLVEIKKKYDPKNRFHHPLSVPVDLPSGS